MNQRPYYNLFDQMCRSNGWVLGVDKGEMVIGVPQQDGHQQGVVVNDFLVLVDSANQFRAQGYSPREAIHAAGVRRFRPILLTSLTTFLGLAPMIFETSVQARFLVPMAISLGFGDAPPQNVSSLRRFGLQGLWISMVRLMWL